MNNFLKKVQSYKFELIVRLKWSIYDFVLKINKILLSPFPYTKCNSFTYFRNCLVEIEQEKILKEFKNNSINKLSSEDILNFSNKLKYEY